MWLNALYLFLPMVVGQPQRPPHAVNITVYHVGQKKYMNDLANMNSGDARGDADFMLRAAGLPYLCSPESGVAKYTYDCDDVEQTADDLVISKTIIEADSRWSEYAECNVDSHTGKYLCECRDHHSHHFHRPRPCNNTVGRIAVVNESGWAHEYPDPRDPFTTAYRYFFYNAAQKFGGIWYSTLGQGECGSVAEPKANCSWRIVETVKVISKKCQEDHVFGVVQQHGHECFDKCHQPLNRSTGCWTNCVYDTVFGKGSNHTAYPSSATSGMDTATVIDAWLGPFETSDPDKGGCPNLNK